MRPLSTEGLNDMARGVTHPAFFRAAEFKTKPILHRRAARFGLTGRLDLIALLPERALP
jgi:hypothetical protein